MSQALITLVAKVTNIGEVVIKGLANIFGAPFHGKCSALRGLKLLGLTLPIEILSSIFTVGLALKQLLIDPALAFKNPKEFIEQQIQMHQKTEEVWLFVAYAEKPGISSFEDFCLSSLITIYGSNGENDLAPIDDSAVKREELEAGLYDL